MVLHYNSWGEYSDAHKVMLINGTFVGYTIILVALFAGYVMNTPINKRIGELIFAELELEIHWNLFLLDIFFSIIGAALFITSGVLILQYWNDSASGKIVNLVTDHKATGITKGSLAVINGIVFIIDVVFTFRD